MAELLFSTEFIIIFSVTLGYLLARAYADHRNTLTAVVTDEERLNRLTVLRERSAYEIFHFAAAAWNISVPRTETDFRDYQREGVLPYYVRDYLRNSGW